MSKMETSPSGQPIYRHEPRQNDFKLALGNEELTERIGEHVEKHIGPIAGVFQEMISDLVHLNVFMVAPTPERNYYTLVTCGMSDLPMVVPLGAEEFRYAELMIALPPTWQLTQEDFKDERNYWPLRALKTLARLPHEYDTWLYIGHTIPNGNPIETFAAGTRLSGMLVSLPTIASDVRSFFRLPLYEGKTVHFYSLLPLYEDEMAYKLKHGADKLFEKLDKAGVNQVLDVRRTSAVKMRFWLF